MNSVRSRPAIYRGRQRELAQMSFIHGSGIVNSLIDKLPIELHLPGYQYCGPGTRLDQRLARGDPGLNPLDAACKQHDKVHGTGAGTSSR